MKLPPSHSAANADNSDHSDHSDLDINAFLASITKKCVDENASNPIAYIIESLHSEFPNDTNAALEVMGNQAR